MTSRPTPLPALAAENAIGNTEVQAPPADSAGQVSSILAPVVASPSFRHTSAPSSEKNSAVLQDNEVNQVQVAVSPLNHEFAARASAEPPVPVATLPSKATHNGLFGGDDAQGTGDGGALTHRTSSRSTTSQGVDVAPEESGESMRMLAGLEKAQGQAPEDSSVKHVKKVVRRHSKQHADKKYNTAVSENLERPPDKSEGVPQCALAEGVPSARTSVPPSSQDPLSEGKVMSSKVASAAASIKARQTPSHAVAARPSSPASDSRGGTYTESGSSSYIHSSRPRGSRRSEVSSTASTSLSFAQRQRVSGAPLRHSSKVSTAPSRVRSAHDASLASHQNHKLTSFLLQEEEHLLRMPAYQRRVLLDLRARERRDAEEAAREWRHLTFRPHIHSSPYNIGADAMRAVVTGRKHSPLASAHESPTYSPVSGFWEPSPGRYQIHRMSPRLLEPRCTPKQPAPPTFKPVISQYAKSSVKPACSVFKRLYRPRSLSPPAVGDGFTHRPNISQLARQLYEHNPDDVAAPHSMSVFDRLYRMRKSPSSGRSTSPRCSVAPTQSFRSRSPEMEVSQSAMRPRQTLQDRPYRNDRPRGHESHSPFHTREEIHSDDGTEDVKAKDSNGGDLSLSQLSFNTRDAVMTSTSLHHFPKTQIEVEAA
ncbi:hypothetical protein JKF63_00427 [Porcisia hertigi]|uniref:Uncharacterized protein n=1 Tax=Porcisia hertigi TaxID=2761500 RepID=A0A836HPZ0_9TRYP|nr:hypothetical protein JKF63_00427 [Porcisia hertigi]